MQIGNAQWVSTCTVEDTYPLKPFIKLQMKILIYVLKKDLTFCTPLIALEAYQKGIPI